MRRAVTEATDGRPRRGPEGKLRFPAARNQFLDHDDVGADERAGGVVLRGQLRRGRRCATPCRE